MNIFWIIFNLFFMILNLVFHANLLNSIVACVNALAVGVLAMSAVFIHITEEK